MSSFLRNLFSVACNCTRSTSRLLQIPLLPCRFKPLGYDVSSYPVPFSRSIHASATLFAEPLKKKKKMDPAIIRAREERKRRRLEKQIRRLEKHQRQLKPFDETEIPISIIDEARQRSRQLPQLPTEVTDARWKLVKEWGNYKRKQVEAEVRFFQMMKHSQNVALDELRNESIFLYEHAIKIDRDLIPYQVKGPTDTPPIENYTFVEGDYIDVSRKWD